jgi:hypothetical protein
MRKSNYKERPLALERHKNGVHVFRWAIEEVTRPAMEEGGEAVVEYECYEVFVENGSSNQTTEVAIDALWGNGVEQKLINDYNAAKEGVFTGEKAARALAAYTQFLQDRQSLKDEIAAAYEESAGEGAE